MSVAQKAPVHEAPEGSFDPEPSAKNLAASLKEMLDCYWGEGDGQRPPFFIQKAQALVDNFYSRDGHAD